MEALRTIRVTKRDSEELGQPLSPTARLYQEPYANGYIIIIMGFKTPINPNVIISNMAHTFLNHPRFSSLQVGDMKTCGELRWMKTKVDIENHVIVPNLDEANIDCPDKFVEDYISNLSKTTISNSKPMWDFHILNIKTCEAESIGILRAHHSIGDGISLMSFLLSSSRKVADPQALPTITTSRRKISSNSVQSKGLLQFFIKLWLLLLLCWNTLIDFVLFLLTIVFLEDTKTPLRSTLKKYESPKRYVHTTISLDDVNLVKNAMNATINDVMVGIIQAGLSHYLKRKYGNLPSDIFLRAVVPVNMRPSSAIHALEEMMRGDVKTNWGNKVSCVLLPLKIAMQNDPLDHIRHAKVVADRKLRESFMAKYIYFIVKHLTKLFGTKGLMFMSKTTLCFSNIPGPQEEISYHGHPVAFIGITCYGQPTALLIHAVRYVNKMRITLSVEESIIPDPHQICNDIQISLNLIKDAILAKRNA